MRARGVLSGPELGRAPALACKIQTPTPLVFWALLDRPFLLATITIIQTCKKSLILS